MGKSFVWDLDGTLSNCDHRVDYAKAKDWPGFHARAKDDKPYPEAVALFHAILTASAETDDECIILTGRTEDHRNATMKWLSDNELFSSSLLMRAKLDFRPDYVIKLDALDQYFGGREFALESVYMIFEDREQVVENLRNAGFVVAQVRNGAF